MITDDLDTFIELTDDMTWVLSQEEPDHIGNGPSTVGTRRGRGSGPSNPAMETEPSAPTAKKTKAAATKAGSSSHGKGKKRKAADDGADSSSKRVSSKRKRFG